MYNRHISPFETTQGVRNHLFCVLISSFVILAMSTPKKTNKSKEIDFNVLLRAIKHCLVEKHGVRPTAREHGIQKSTLQRYLRKVEANFDDVTTVPDGALIEFVRTCHTRTP